MVLVLTSRPKIFHVVANPHAQHPAQQGPGFVVLRIRDYLIHNKGMNNPITRVGDGRCGVEVAAVHN